MERAVLEEGQTLDAGSYREDAEDLTEVAEGVLELPVTYLCFCGLAGVPLRSMTEFLSRSVFCISASSVAFSR